jgi:DNA-binding MarR family transcriptional regulator
MDRPGRRRAVPAGPANLLRAGAPTVPHSLPALLSQALVAFTIEFDNEFEHRMPHRTARGPAAGSAAGPWLVSLALWANFLQFVPAEGVPLRDVLGPARSTNLAGLQRWGYVVLEPDPGDDRAEPPRRDWLIRPTVAGRQAQQVWRPLAGEIEERWQTRFGSGEFARLTGALRDLAGQFGGQSAPYLPLAGVYKSGSSGMAPDRTGGAALSELLSRALLAFRDEFERESVLSLPVSANALRVLSPEGMRLRDLPRLAGVSKEAISVSVGLLERRACAATGPDPAATRGQVVRLTPRGRRAQDEYHRLVDVIGDRWRDRFGTEVPDRLADSLRNLFGQAGPEGQSLMAEGLRPYPDGWRAHSPYLGQTRALLSDPGGALPHYPMVTHRGGYPDGS